MAKVDYEELSKELDRLLDLFEAKGVLYAVAGGFAVAFHGRQRLTEDIDLAVRPPESQALVDALKTAGYQQFTAPMVLGKGAIEIARLVRLVPGGETFIVDVLVPRSSELIDAAGDRVRRGGAEHPMWVLSRRALITFKQSRNSKQDQADIEALESLHDDD
jgi:hypothetical protein